LAWAFSSWNKVSLGDAETAIARVTHAMRLSPNDTYVFGMQGAMASAHLVAGRYAEALAWAQKATKVKPDLFFPVVLEAACAGLAGELEQAHRTMATLRAIDPELRISNVRNLVSYLQPEHHAKLVDGLRKAGLPD
jgi:Flp pilus assembly protein TadD